MARGPEGRNADPAPVLSVGNVARYGLCNERKKTGVALLDIIRSRYILLAVALVGICVLVYFVGAFYHQYLNDPIDFASLFFIIAIYVGAVYHQVRGFEKK
jgi:hypothetical protein